MRQCFVVLNLANLTGALNHAIKHGDGSYSKIRIDYKALLETVVSGRSLLGAYCVSQQDTSPKKKSAEELQKNERFLNRLSKFGWNPFTVTYDRDSGNMDGIKDSIWNELLSPYCDSEGTFIHDPSTIDVIFITGSSTWEPIIDKFHENGFCVEIAYIKKCTYKPLLVNYAFNDLGNFIISEYQKINDKTSSKV